MDQAAGTNGDSLEAVRATIQRQLGQRVRNFELKREQDALILTGSTHTYYAKQLIQHLVMGQFEGTALRNEIDVAHSSPALVSREEGKPSSITRKDKTMTTAPFEITYADRDRVSEFLDRKSAENGWHDITRQPLRLLRQKLANARCLESTDISPDVVTIGSIVHIFELDTGERWKFTLSFPSNANIDEGRISVLAPLGTAILGHHVGDVVDWPVPSGMIRIQIVQIDYQPEAAGVFDEPELSVT